MMAPIIPSLNSEDIMKVAETGANAGALSFAHTVVRLNGKIAMVFKDWMTKNFPDRADKVIRQVESLHGGKLNDSRFGRKIKGSGNIAAIIYQQVKIARQMHYSGRKMPDYNLNAFRKQQLRLF